jgi:hypothetical protein
MEDPQFYWHLILKDDFGKDGEIIKVKPDPENVKRIQDMIAKNEGAITTPTRSIPINRVKEFRLSDERYSDQKLLEGTAQAFGEPIYTETVVERNGEKYTYHGVAAKWVKKSVPRRRWDTYYRFMSGHKKLEDNDSYVTMAFVLPVHSIDYAEVQDVTGEEYLKLSREPS